MLLYRYDLDFEIVYNSLFEYDALSEDSDTGEVIDFKNM